jgi:hypothetical protein
MKYLLKGMLAVSATLGGLAAAGAVCALGGQWLFAHHLGWVLAVLLAVIMFLLASAWVGQEFWANEQRRKKYGRELAEMGRKRTW